MEKEEEEDAVHEEAGSRGDERLPPSKRGRHRLDLSDAARRQHAEEEEEERDGTTHPGAEVGEAATEGASSSGSLFAELAAAAVRAKENTPAIESNLLWYQRRAAGLAADLLDGDGVSRKVFSCNFRTRQGALFQIDPNSLPAPLPKPSHRTPVAVPRESSNEDEEKAEGEEEVCLYDPEQSEEMAVPVGYHRTSRLVAGREVVYLREGTGQENNQASVAEKGKEPSEESATPATDNAQEASSEDEGESHVGRGSTVQPLKKRWRDA